MVWPTKVLMYLTLFYGTMFGKASGDYMEGRQYKGTRGIEQLVHHALSSETAVLIVFVFSYPTKTIIVSNIPSSS